MLYHCKAHTTWLLALPVLLPLLLLPLQVTMPQRSIDSSSTSSSSSSSSAAASSGVCGAGLLLYKGYSRVLTSTSLAHAAEQGCTANSSSDAEELFALIHIPYRRVTLLTMQLGSA
jgi:hypothetical protein